MEMSLSLDTQRSERLAELYALHAPRAGRMAYLLIGDRDLAEDIVQEAFVRVAARFFAMKNPESFPAYLNQTVLNLARGHVRKAMRDRSLLQRLHLERPREGAMPDVGSRDHALQLLQALPYRQRAAIVLRFYLDFSEQQTAELLGCAVGTVKSLVSRGIQVLRERMGVEHEA